MNPQRVGKFAKPYIVGHNIVLHNCDLPNYNKSKLKKKSIK